MTLMEAVHILLREQLFYYHSMLLTVNPWRFLSAAVQHQ